VGSTGANRRDERITDQFVAVAADLSAGNWPSAETLAEQTNYASSS
jgi:hypothetical protein